MYKYYNTYYKVFISVGDGVSIFGLGKCLSEFISFVEKKPGVVPEEREYDYTAVNYRDVINVLLGRKPIATIIKFGTDEYEVDILISMKHISFVSEEFKINLEDRYNRLEFLVNQYIKLS